MSASISDIEAVLNQIRMDLTNAQAKITEAKRMVGALPIERERPKWSCELCVGGLAFATEEKLHAHQALVHEVGVGEYERWDAHVGAVTDQLSGEPLDASR